MISVQGVSHAIGQAEILTDITLDIPRGGVTALSGRTGRGSRRCWG